VKSVADEQGDDEADVHVCSLCKAALLFYDQCTSWAKLLENNYLCTVVKFHHATTVFWTLVFFAVCV